MGGVPRFVHLRRRLLLAHLLASARIGVFVFHSERGLCWRRMNGPWRFHPPPRHLISSHLISSTKFSSLCMLSVCLSTCLSVCLPVSPSVCLYVCLPSGRACHETTTGGALLALRDPEYPRSYQQLPDPVHRSRHRNRSGSVLRLGSCRGTVHVGAGTLQQYDMIRHAGSLGRKEEKGGK